MLYFIHRQWSTEKKNVCHCDQNMSHRHQNVENILGYQNTILHMLKCVINEGVGEFTGIQYLLKTDKHT